MRYLRLARALMFLLACGTCGQPHATAGLTQREPIVGLPCEGCEAVFDGLPSVLSPRRRIAPSEEPGEPMRIEGTITARDDRPVSGVIVYAYHTDAAGRYPRGGPAVGEAARRHGRLRGWVATDARGRYRFDTIRPASYPDNATPAHVHMHVIEPGRCTYYIDSIHFDDDQRLSRQEREQLVTGRGGSGLVRPRRDSDGTWIVTRDIRLGEGVPEYPAARSGQDDAQALGAYVASQFRSAEPGGVVLVARGDRPLLRSAYGLADVAQRRAMTVGQPLPIGSVTKSFTAGAILSLVRTGEVALGDDVRQHVAEAPVGDTLVTIEQLLTHTSGLPTLIDVPGFLDWAREPRSTTGLLARTHGVPFRFEPGTGFAYSDTGYILLGAVLERHHKGTWSDAVRDLVARPLGLASVASAERLPGDSAAIGYGYDGTGFVVSRPIDWSVPHASGSLVATVDDLLTWVRAWRAGAVATRELSERAWAGRTLPDDTRSGYGFGWKRCDFEGRTAIQHGGWVPGFTASVLHLPDQDLTAVALLNSTDNVEASYLARRALRLLLTGSAERPPRVLTTEERANLVGRYRTDSGDTWTLVAEENGLVLRLAGQRVPLAALSPTKLCAADSDGTWCFTFGLGPEGRASSLAVDLTCEPQGKARREE